MGEYVVEIVREGVKAETSPGSGKFEVLPVGTILSGDRWILVHCLTGFRNKPALAVPADEHTAAAVSAIVEKRAPHKAAERRMMQKRVDALAASGRFQIDAATGFFARDIRGELAGKMSKVERHILETAEAYGIKPAVPETPAAVEPVPAVVAVPEVPAVPEAPAVPFVPEAEPETEVETEPETELKAAA